MSSIKELMAKLKRLAESSNEFEAANARRKLEALMKESGWEESDLDNSEATFHNIWGIHSQRQFALLHQVVYKVMGVPNEYVYSSEHKKARAVLCTRDQFLLISYLFRFYWDNWEKEQDAMWHAYIQKHKIFGQGYASDDGKELSMEEMYKLRKRMAALGDLEPQSLLDHKSRPLALEHKT